jgi:hypothetical protein
VVETFSTPDKASSIAGMKIMKTAPDLIGILVLMPVS